MNHITVFVTCNPETNRMTALSFRRNRTFIEQLKAPQFEAFVGKKTCVYMLIRGAKVDRKKLLDLAIWFTGQPDFVNSMECDLS
jgi:hypothetical protein